MKRKVLTLLLLVGLMACEKSVLAPLPSPSGLSSFRFTESNDEVLFFVPYSSSYSRGASSIEAKGLTSPVALAFDSSSYLPDTLSSFGKHLFIYPHLYTVSENSAKRLQSVIQSRWHRSYIAAVNDTYLVLAGKIAGSQGDSVTNLEIFKMDGNPLAVGSLDLSDPRVVALQGDVAYVSDEKKLKVIDLKQPGYPSLVKTIALPNARHICVAENKLIVTSGSEIHQFDVTDPRNPVFLTTIR